MSRFEHTLSHVDGKLYIYGGLVAENTLAGDEMHILNLSNTDGSEYSCIPALSKDVHTPKARYGHSAVVISGKIIVYGGADLNGILDEGNKIWHFE